MSTRAWLDSKRQYLSSSRSTPPPTISSLNNTIPQLHIGTRVQVNSLSGVIRFIGPTKFKAGTWAGVELDTIGMGKNDGSVDGKRYFICPPNTGIFILTIKLLKQQHYLALNNRPSTPHQTTIKTTHNTNSIPPLPKKVILPSKDNENDELIKKLQQENKLLKQSNQHLEQTIKDIKSASMNSIEILENLITTHQTKINELEKDLKNERLKYNELKYKENEMRTHSLEAIELTIVELEKSNEKSQKLISENEKMSKRHHTEIQILLQDINVLEAVLQDKMNKQVDLVQSLKKEKQINYKLLNEPLSINTTTNNSRFNTTRERLLDTPIQEVDEEDEEDDTFNNNCCALCDKKGHHLIHCNAITTY